ncbi:MULTISPECIES: hypothetical protein [Peptoniphilus]|uniref:hypothetical protein n=1 Tax=Peptoniphilus TaxID=162289 RepID=UPI0005670BEB|nr:MULTISPECIES: hypothetical protein [Peptoniphilus]
MSLWTTEAKKQIGKLYELNNIGDKKAIYNLFSSDFKNSYTLDEFLKSKKFRVLDIGRLRDIICVQSCGEKILVRCKIYIGGCELIHNFKCIVEKNELKIIFERFFIRN